MKESTGTVRSPQYILQNSAQAGFSLAPTFSLLLTVVPHQSKLAFTNLT